MKLFKRHSGRNCPTMNVTVFNSFAHLLFLAFCILLVACEKKEDSESKEGKIENHYLIHINGKQKIVTTDLSDPEKTAISTVRFVMNGTLKSSSCEGNWDFDCQMYNLMDYKENVPDPKISGYMSGSLKWSSLKVPVSRLTLGAVPPPGSDFSTWYSSSPHDFKMPFFNAIPGPFDYTVIGDDGKKYQFKGSQLFFLGYPTKMEVSIGGSSKEPELSNRVIISFVMVDTQELAVTNVSLNGDLLVFKSEKIMQDWLLAHPFPDYSKQPLLITSN